MLIKINKNIQNVTIVNQSFKEYKFGSSFDKMIEKVERDLKNREKNKKNNRKVG